MATKHRLLVKNASQVVVVCSQGEKYLTKNAMQKLSLVENGSVAVGW